jgi:hypothetical protein
VGDGLKMVEDERAFITWEVSVLRSVSLLTAKGLAVEDGPTKGENALQCIHRMTIVHLTWYK